jgi:hypothetical protein
MVQKEIETFRRLRGWFPWFRADHELPKTKRPATTQRQAAADLNQKAHTGLDPLAPESTGKNAPVKETKVISLEEQAKDEAKTYLETHRERRSDAGQRGRASGSSCVRVEMS